MTRRSEPGNRPGDFDGIVEWFDRISYALVLLDDRPLPAVRADVAAFATAVSAHSDGPAASDGSLALGSADRRRALRADHDRFRTSVRQLWWFYDIVERDDHGGNRQALGQYGRLVCEALRRHRTDEREVDRAGAAGGSGTPTPRPSEQR